MDSGHLGKAFHGAEHYENFPVGSWLIPAPARSGLIALYRFARAGDDLADEPGLPNSERLCRLQALRQGLTGLAPCPPRQDPLASYAELGRALAEALSAASLSTRPAEDLLRAFEQDVSHEAMADPTQVLNYCSLSANPVGRLVLGLTQIEPDVLANTALLRFSDAICTGLQLANFAQDLGEDFERGRIYVPATWVSSLDLGKFAGRDSVRRRCMEIPLGSRQAIALRMARWAEDFLRQGEPLPRELRRHPNGGYRLAMEISLTIAGGLAICKKVANAPQNVWMKSPRLSKTDLALILWPAIRRIF
jgi:squalene synthase HpnC